MLSGVGRRSRRHKRNPDGRERFPLPAVNDVEGLVWADGRRDRMRAEESERESKVLGHSFRTRNVTPDSQRGEQAVGLPKMSTRPIGIAPRVRDLGQRKPCSRHLESGRLRRVDVERLREQTRRLAVSPMGLDDPAQCPPGSSDAVAILGSLENLQSLTNVLAGALHLPGQEMRFTENEQEPPTGLPRQRDRRHKLECLLEERNGRSRVAGLDVREPQMSQGVTSVERMR